MRFSRGFSTVVALLLGLAVFAIVATAVVYTIQRPAPSAPLVTNTSIVNVNKALPAHIENIFPGKVVYTLGEKAQRQADCASRQGLFSECGSSCEPGKKVCTPLCRPTCLLKESDDSYDLSKNWTVFVDVNQKISFRYPYDMTVSMQYGSITVSDVTRKFEINVSEGSLNPKAMYERQSGGTIDITGNPSVQIDGQTGYFHNGGNPDGCKWNSVLAPFGERHTLVVSAGVCENETNDFYSDDQLFRTLLSTISYVE